MNAASRHLLLALFLLSIFQTRGEETNNLTLAPYTSDLMTLDGDSLTPFKAEKLSAARYIVLYFGAGWCVDCRRFSPSLVAAYDKQPEGKPRFEVVLMTMDKTADGMLKFMKSEKMRWPALAFEKVAGAQSLKKYYSGHGIPCLSVLDQKGNLVLQSKSDQDAREILKQLEDLVKNES